MTGSTTPDFDSLTVDGAALAGSVQSTGTGTITAGNAGSADILRISPRTAGSTPLIASDGPGAKVGITINAKGGGDVHVSNGTFSVGPPAFTLNGAAAVTPGVNVVGTWNGNTSVAPQFNQVNILDHVDASAGASPKGFAVNHTYGGGQGGRIGFISTMLQSAAQVNTPGDQNTYQAGQFTLFPNFSEPGATRRSPVGAFECLSSNAQLQASANVQNAVSLISFEADVGIYAPCTSATRVAYLAGIGGDTQGFQTDAALWIISAPSVAGLRHGVLFGGTQDWPMAASGTLIGAVQTGFVSSVASAKWAFDAEQVVFPSTGHPGDGGSFRSNGFSVDGIGTTRIGSAYLTPGAAGLTIDAKGSVGTAAAIAAGGSGYITGSRTITTAYGGLWTGAVDVSGNFSGSLTQISAPAYDTASPPANPITAIDLFRNGSDGGSGLTLNLTWNTTGNAVAIQPTAGGKLGFNGATPVVKPTGVAVTAAGIHAALVSLGLIAP